MLEYVRNTQSQASETESGENKGFCKTPAFPASLGWTQRNPVEIFEISLYKGIALTCN